MPSRQAIKKSLQKYANSQLIVKCNDSQTEDHCVMVILNRPDIPSLTKAVVVTKFQSTKYSTLENIKAKNLLFSREENTKY